MDTITNVNGQLVSCVGENAVTAFSHKALIGALKLEKLGMKLSRGTSALAIAKRTTGLRTNNRDLQIARLQVMMEARMAQCVIVTDGK